MKLNNIVMNSVCMAGTGCTLENVCYFFIESTLIVKYLLATRYKTNLKLLQVKCLSVFY